MRLIITATPRGLVLGAAVMLCVFSSCKQKEDPEFYIRQGNARCLVGDFAGGIAQYNRAIELFPKSALAYSSRGNARARKRDYDGAIADLNKALELDPANAEPLITRGQVRVQQGDTKSAIADFKKAAEIQPAFKATAQQLIESLKMKY